MFASRWPQAPNHKMTTQKRLESIGIALGKEQKTASLNERALIRFKS